MCVGIKSCPGEEVVLHVLKFIILDLFKFEGCTELTKLLEKWSCHVLLGFVCLFVYCCLPSRSSGERRDLACPTVRPPSLKDLRV